MITIFMPHFFCWVFSSMCLPQAGTKAYRQAVSFPGQPKSAVHGGTGGIYGYACLQDSDKSESTRQEALAGVLHLATRSRVDTVAHPAIQVFPGQQEAVPLANSGRGRASRLEALTGKALLAMRGGVGGVAHPAIRVFSWTTGSRKLRQKWEC